MRRCGGGSKLWWCAVFEMRYGVDFTEEVDVEFVVDHFVMLVAEYGTEELL